MKSTELLNKFTQRELGILENTFSENTPMKEITISNLLSIKSNVDEHIYEEGWINGEGNESEEYLEEAGVVRDILNTLTEDEGEELYRFLMERKNQQIVEVAE